MVEEQIDGQIDRRAAPQRRTGRRLLVALLLLLMIAGGIVVAAWQIPAAQRHMRALLGQPAEPARQVMALPPPVATPLPTSSVPPPPAAQAQAQAAQTASTPASPSWKSGFRGSMSRPRPHRATPPAPRGCWLPSPPAARSIAARSSVSLKTSCACAFPMPSPMRSSTLVDAASKPVTLDTLYAELDALAPKLTGEAPAEDNWGWLKHEVSAAVHHPPPGCWLHPSGRPSGARQAVAGGGQDRRSDQRS